jgi:hypothetical protein
VDPSSIVARAEDLSPAVAQLADAYRKGFVTADQIIQRYGTAGIAKEKAEVAEAGAQVAEAGVRKQMAQAVTPEMIAMRAQAEQGGLEGQIAQQAVMKETRAGRDKIFRAQVAQALDELETGMPAETVQQLEMQYPHIVKPQRDTQGRIINRDEVRAQIGHAVQMQKAMDQLKGLMGQFESKQVTTKTGQPGLQTVWRGTNNPVPQWLVQLATQAQTGQIFGAPGTFAQVPGAVTAAAAGQAPPVFQEAVDLNAPAPVPGEQQPGLATGTVPSEPELGPLEKELRIGTMTPEGILVTGNPELTNRLIPSEGMNKFFQLRMAAENVQDVARTYKNIRENSPNLIGVVKGRIAGPALGEWDEFYKVLQNAVQSTVPGMARGVFGEVGVLSDKDIENYSKLLPTAKTDPDVAEKILVDIMKKTQRAVKLILDSYDKAGYNTSGFQELKQMALEEEARLAGGGTAYDFPGGPGAPNLDGSARQPGAFGGPLGGVRPTPGGPSGGVRVQDKSGKTGAFSGSIPRFKSILEVPPDVTVFWLEGEPTPRRR